MTKVRRVLVTGGCGFIGVNLGRALSASGREVVAFDDGSAGSSTDALECGYSEIITGDIRDGDALAKASVGVDAVVHLAAMTGVRESLANPRHDLDVNVAGTLNALLAARDADATAFVFASSAAPIGDAEPPMHEQLPARPKSPYGASKLSGEGLCSAFAASYGLATTALRFSNVYGPFSYHKGSVIALFIKRILDGESLTIFGDGTQTRDFVYVDDICAAIMAALDLAPTGELIQLGTGTETSVLDLVALLERTYPDREFEVEYLPPQPGEVQRSCADISHARSVLGYDPAMTLEAGLARTRDWFSGLEA